MNRTPLLLTILLLTTAISLSNCTLPRVIAPPATPTHTAVPENIPTETATAPPPFPTVELGLAENPLILALPPAANTARQIEAANLIASLFIERTGYTVVTVVPDSYTALVDAFERGNAHIAVLDPYAYELAYQRDLVRAVYGLMNDGESLYGAQFLATRKGGFESYYDPTAEENTEAAAIALAQFLEKKPCWSDEMSPSGYVIPLGYLNENQIITRSPAFVEGHPTVVRSLYASGICDFGATYIDARKFPSLEDEFPDLIEQVIVVWRIPDIIPYEILVFSSAMSPEMRELFTTQIAAIMQTDNGRAAFKSAYGIEELQVVNDGFYAEFRRYLARSALDLRTLVK